MERIGGSCFCLDTYVYKLLKNGINNKDIYHFSYKKPVHKRVARWRNSGAVISTRFLSSSHCVLLSVFAYSLS